MCFFVNFFFNCNNGSFSLQTSPLHFLLSSSYLLRACAHFPQRPLKLRSTIATDSRVNTVVVRGVTFPWPQQDPSHGDTSEPESHGRRRPKKQHGASSAEISATEAKTAANRAPSSSSSSSSLSSVSTSSSSPTLSGSPSTSPGSHPSITSTNNGGSPFEAVSSSSSHVERCGCNITDGALSSVDPAPRFKQLSHMSKVIKAAFDVVQGWKVIQKLSVSSLEGVLLVGSAGNWVILSVKATKIFAKGLKMSQKVLTSKPFSKLICKGGLDHGMVEKLINSDLASLAKGFNAFYAAIKVAQFSKSLTEQAHEGNLPHTKFIWKGYEVFKSLVSILDAVVGKKNWALTSMGKGFVIVKKGIEGIGIMIKAMFLSKELGAVVLKRVAISGGTFAAVFGTCRHAHKIAPSKAKMPLCMTKEAPVNDRAIAPSCKQSVQYDSLLCLVLLFGLLSEDTNSICVNYSEEAALQSVLCLALPLTMDKFLVFA